MHFLHLVLLCLFWGMEGYAQLPTVYFNEIYPGTTSNNNISITTQVSGQNFRFVGNSAGSNGIFVDSSGMVPGKLIYVSSSGSNIIYSGVLNLRDTRGSNDIYGFVFEEKTPGTAKFYVTNPVYDASISGNTNGINVDNGNITSTLNTMRNNQVVLISNYFVSNFSTCLSTSSAVQTFTISGEKLASNVTVTAPSNFEVSTSQTGTYTSSITFTPSSGTLSISTVYLRLKSLGTTGSYSGNVTISATNAATQTYLATGDVVATTAISASPSSPTICSGNAITFSVTAAGGGLTYQWQVSTDNGSTYSNISNTGIYTGATTSVLRLASGVTTSYSGYKYQCVVTGSCGSATSSAATLTVNSPISITTPPSSSAICEGVTTTFSVSATGTSPSYQWKVSTNSGVSYTNISAGSTYSGETTATLTITGATAGMSGYKYQCVVTGTCTSATSDAATLTINSVPSTPGTITGNSSICSNTNQSYSIAAVSGATSYGWVLPSGWTGTSTTNSINVVNSSTSGNIQVRAENACGNSSYLPLAVTVSGTSAPTPSFTINNQQQCLSGNSFVLTNSSTAADGTNLSSSLWNFGDGSSESTTTSPAKSYNATGTYVVRLTVTASNGCVSSITKEVIVNGAPTGQISGTTSICNGSSATLSVNLTGQGPWLMNYTDGASPVSISSSPYTFSVSPTTTTTFQITSLSDSKCAAASGDMTGSAIVTVNSNVTPAVTISSSDADNSICSTNSVTFSSSGLSNEGASPSYQWLKNGIAISLATSSSYTTTDLVDNDVISLQMISNSTSCLTTNSIISNTIQTEVHPGAPATPMAISGDTTQCTSLSNQVYSIASVLNASTYTWSVPAGWSINSGSGTTSIVVTIGSSSGTSNVTVTAGNGCGTSTQQLLPVAVSSSSSNPINLTSANDGQTKCINTALANITYSSSGGTGASFSGLPTGVSGAYSGGTITISGTPTVAGSYTYTITLTGGGCDYTKTGTITVTAANTVSLSSSSGTNAQTKCINTAITNITYSTTGATSVTVDGLPSGVEDNWSGGVLTISGTPTVAGVHTYTVTLNGGCGNVTTTGTISVTAANTITLATGSSTQTKCLNSAITNTTYTTTGATAATFSGLPSGVSGSWSSNTATISGTPTTAGAYNYTITLAGGCANVTSTGTITVSSLPSPATISSTNGPICAGYNAQFSLSGPSSSVVTYNITSGSSGTPGSNTTVSLNGNGVGTVTISDVPASQKITLVSVQDASNLCTTSLSANSTVLLRSEDEWTSKGNNGSGGSDVYHAAVNWCKNAVPDDGASIVIPTGVTGGRYPRLNGQSGQVANIQINDGATLDLDGNSFVITGSITGNGKFKGKAGSTLQFTGTGNVGTLNLDQTSNSTKTIGSLIMNRTSSDSLVIGTSAIIGTLTLTAGNIHIGNNDVILTSSGSQSSNSHIKSTGTGKIKTLIASGSSFTFPIGRAAYNPITITNNNATADSFSVNLVDEVYASYDASGVGTTLLTGPRVKRTWNIGKTNANGGTGITLTFNWNAGETSGTITTPALYHHESGAWVKQTGTSSSPTSTSFRYTGYTGTFSPFAIGDAATNLPVTWLSFTAAKLQNGVQLNWSTASEVNTKDFVVEYSNNTQQWTPLGTVQASNNTTTVQNYSYYHANPLKNNTYNYYRILQRDLDGKFSYSKIVSIIFNEPGPDMSVYPNPVSDVLTVYLSESKLVRLSNAAGAIVWQSNLPAGRNQISVSQYSKGVYILTAGVQSYRVIIQ